jgi:predicted dienelactone hydrolase
MRPLEIGLAIILWLQLLWFVFRLPSRKKWSVRLLVLGFFTLLLHLIIEGYRWQMIPLYTLTLMFVVLTIFTRYRRQNNFLLWRGWKITTAIIGILLLTLATTLPALLPVPKVPKPTGPYGVGTISSAYTDPNRMELYADQPEGQREFLIQVWYPIDPDTRGRAAPWMEDMEIMGPAIAEWIGLPSFFLDHIRLTKTNAILQANIAGDGGPFPILIFSHGWGGFRSQNTYQVEELASHGYVVIAIQHTYGAVATVLPDGDVAYINPEALPSGLPDSESRLAANLLVSQWAGDMAFIIDQFGKLNQSDPEARFTGQLDTDRIGVFGHSTGGGAAIEFCANDSRCNAILGLDAYMTPVSDETIDKGLNQPALFLFSQTWSSEKNNQLFDELQTKNNAEIQSYTILGTSHYDFSDLPMLSPLAPQLGLKGPLNGKRVLRIINDYTLAFFNLYLKEMDSSIPQSQSEDYPEVIVR